MDTSAERPWMQTALFGTTKELEGLLDQGLDANSRTPKGTTVLMMAAPMRARSRCCSRVAPMSRRCLMRDTTR